jgi:hypothetical protein
VDLFIFGTAEPATAIMAASIPVLRALIKRESVARHARFVELEAGKLSLQEREGSIKLQSMERARTQDSDRKALQEAGDAETG